jgi:hypothetical protein
MPDNVSAAATLLEGLLRPGFDPARGAESTRRYVSRKASLAILERKKLDHATLRPWESFGIGERYYYKLLKRLASKESGSHLVDETVGQRIFKYLRGRDEHIETKTQLMELLQVRGFSRSAARKWLYRHRPEEALSAWPRGSRHPSNRNPKTVGDDPVPRPQPSAGIGSRKTEHGQGANRSADSLEPFGRSDWRYALRPGT